MPTTTDPDSRATTRGKNKNPNEAIKRVHNNLQGVPNHPATITESVLIHCNSLTQYNVTGTHRDNVVIDVEGCCYFS